MKKKKSLFDLTFEIIILILISTFCGFGYFFLIKLLASDLNILIIIFLSLLVTSLVSLNLMYYLLYYFNKENEFKKNK